MIAEAIKKQCPEFRNISVDLSTTRFTDPTKGLRYTYLTPRPAQEALIDFDEGKKPTPFEFTLKIAANVVRVHNTTAKTRDPAERKAAQAEQVRANTIIRSEIQSSNIDTVYRPPTEHVERVVRAMDDPTANLGPAIAVIPQGGKATSVPMIVGGRSPPRGNLGKIRRFGLRQLRG